MPTTPTTPHRLDAEIAAAEAEVKRLKRIRHAELTGERVRAMWADPQRRAEMTATFQTPEMRAKRSANAKAQFADPGHRAKLLARLRDPEVVAKAQATMAAKRGEPKRTRTTASGMRNTPMDALERAIFGARR